MSLQMNGTNHDPRFTILTVAIVNFSRSILPAATAGRTVAAALGERIHGTGQQTAGRQTTPTATHLTDRKSGRGITTVNQTFLRSVFIFVHTFLDQNENVQTAQLALKKAMQKVHKIKASN